MFCCKVLFQLLVVEVVLRISATIPAIADVTSFVFLSTVRIQLIISIEPLSTESTLRVTPEAGLIYCAWVVVTVSLVLPQLAEREQLMFVGKDFFVSCAKIAHGLAVLCFDVPV